MSARTSRDILNSPLTWVNGVLSDSSESGKKIWTEDAEFDWDDKHYSRGVLSIQPGGAIQHRPEGTDGAYERGTLDGKELTYPVGPAVFRVVL
jgi:hypothetical protein